MTDLGTAWFAWWVSAERKLMPPIATHAKVTRFAEWYTRAFVLMPPATQAKLVHPSTLDATVWAAIDDQLQQTGDGAQAQGAFAAQQLTALAKGVGVVHDKLLTTVLVVGGVAIAGGVVYLLIQGRTLTRI